MLVLRFQRNLTAEISSFSMAIFETVQIVAMASVLVTAAIASHVLQNFRDFFGHLVSSTHFGIAVDVRAQRYRADALRLGR